MNGSTGGWWRSMCSTRTQCRFTRVGCAKRTVYLLVYGYCLRNHFHVLLAQALTSGRALEDVLHLGRKHLALRLGYFVALQLLRVQFVYPLAQVLGSNPPNQALNWLRHF